MESQLAPEAVHVRQAETWTELAFASLRRSDRHVSDEEIYQLLNVDTGQDAAELFAAKGVTVPMYCLWKAKYRHLTLDELRETRRRELARARRTFAALVAIVLLGGGGLAAALAGVARHTITVAADEYASAAASARSESAAEHPRSEHLPAAAASVSTAKPGRDTSESPENSESPRVVLPAVTETGYRIQVAAANTVHEGRALVSRLASAGHAAYLLPANVNGAEVFRVRVGPFETLEAAHDVAVQLKREGYTAAWIAR